MVKFSGVAGLILVLSLTLGASELLAQDLESIVLKDAGSGAQYELSRLKNVKAGVLIFFGNHCAYNGYYVDRLKKMASDFSNKEVAIVLINANSSKIIVEESEEYMKRYLIEHQLNLPYLIDAKQTLKKSLNATRSPEAYLVASKGGKLEVIYAGAIDDSPQSEGDVNHPYLRNAILNLLNNEAPAEARVRPVGCLIR